MNWPPKVTCSYLNSKVQGSETCPRWETAGIIFSPQNHLKKSSNSCFFFFFLVSLAPSHLLFSWFRALSYFSIVPECCFKSWGVYLFNSKGCRRKDKVLLLLLFSYSVVSDSLWPHELQHTRLLCPSPFPGVFTNSYPLRWWCHPTISPAVAPF